MSPTPRISDLPEKGRALFDELAEELPVEAVGSLREEVRAHLEAFRTAARRNDLLPVDLAEALAAALERLLDVYPHLSPDHRRLAVGAARYFVSDDDARPDMEGVLGLDDDVVVFNWVVRQLDRRDMVLDV